jgi:hypothetical protein
LLGWRSSAASAGQSTSGGVYRPLPVKLARVDGPNLTRHRIVGIAKLPISPWSGKAAYSLRMIPSAALTSTKCLDPNRKITLEANAIVQPFASYAEVSLSGNGVHIVINAKLPGSGRRSGRIEIYDSERYFTVSCGDLRELAQRRDNYEQVAAHAPYARNGRWGFRDRRGMSRKHIAITEEESLGLSTRSFEIATPSQCL